MRRSAPVLFFCALALLLSALTASAQKRGPLSLPPETLSASASSDSAVPSPHQTILVPTGTKISVAVTSPVWTRNAHPGDTIYGVTAFPVVVGDQMAVPAGTSVQGVIDSITKPSWHSSRGEVQLHLTELIFANGYFVPLDMLLPTRASAPPPPSTSTDPVEQAYFAARNRVGGAPAATVYLEVSSKSDVLLDNGTQFNVLVGQPLQLDAARIANDVSVAKAPELTQFHSATQCRYVPGTPGTPGTPDTVIPGTPGTPPTVIPGINGAPPTVIPGTPATPPTVIPGTPGTPGTPAQTCPGPPTVTSQPLNGAATMHTESFALVSHLLLNGHPLTPGNYKVTWTGSAPDLQVLLTRKDQPDVSASAHLVSLPSKARANVATPRSNADGTASLQSLQFKGQTLALYFDPPATSNSAASLAAPPGN